MMSERDEETLLGTIVSHDAIVELKKRERRIKRVAATVVLAFWGALFYVAVHFIRKWW